ncbi:MAG: AAA family ATPase [Planctomycetota bacterium]
MTSNRTSFPDPIEIQAHLDGEITGQARAKRDLAVAIYNHYIAKHTDGENTVAPQHLLLIGPAGVGKSFLVQAAAEMLGVPWIHADASSLVQPVMAGEELERIIGGLIQRSGGDFDRAQKGIILIDQLDSCRRTISGPGDPGIAVQDALLAMMDGLVMKQKDSGETTLDTSGILFICCGSFPELPEIMLNRIDDDERIGFQSEESDDDDATDKPTNDLDLNDIIERKDLVMLGIGEELASRFGSISLLNKLNEKDFVHILKKLDNSIIVQKKKFWAHHGIDLHFDDGSLKAIAAKAEQSDEGARGLHGIIERVLDPIDHRPVELARSGVIKIEINEACVNEGVDPQMQTASESGANEKLESLLTDAWSSLKSTSGSSENSAIPIDPAIHSMPLSNVVVAVDQLEMSMGRLGLNTQQDRTWRALRKTFEGEGRRVILQLLARAQQVGISLAQLCEALEQHQGDLVATLQKIEKS